MSLSRLWMQKVFTNIRHPRQQPFWTVGTNYVSRLGRAAVPRSSMARIEMAIKDLIFTIIPGHWDHYRSSNSPDSSWCANGVQQKLQGILQISNRKNWLPRLAIFHHGITPASPKRTRPIESEDLLAQIEDKVLKLTKTDETPGPVWIRWNNTTAIWKKSLNGVIRLILITTDCRRCDQATWTAMMTVSK
jgi:hypothetical protein